MKNICLAFLYSTLCISFPSYAEELNLEMPPIAALDSESIGNNEKLSSESYPVSKIILNYQIEHPEHISIKDLKDIPISFLMKDGVLYGPSSMLPDAESQVLTIREINHLDTAPYFSQSGLKEIIETLFDFFQSNDIHWTYIYIPSDEITVEGKDLRSEKDFTLKIMITTPVATDSAFTFVDSGNPEKQKERPRQVKRIQKNLPLSLADPSTGYPGDFINSNLLNNYLHSLNRHPGKRVDLEIGPTGVPGQVAFDFVVSEDQPYHFYFNANNNVPKVIDRWQESIGFIHTQLTGNDDTLKLDAFTDSFDRLYNFCASYEAPLGASIGSRWQISGSYSRFISAEFALPQNLFVGTQAIITGEIVSNIAQWNKLFLDIVADLQYRHIHNKGHFLFSSATKNFILPSIGLKAVQLKRETKLIASLSLQSTMSSLFWDVRKGLNNLGRRDLSPNWAILQGGLYGSFYLEPLWHRPNHVKRLANEIVVIGQFQTAFNQRLIPELEGILGGLYTVRGYPQSTISGDNFYMGSAEYRLHVPQTFRPRPRAKCKIFGKSFRWAPATEKGEVDWDFVLRAFYDVGQTTVNQKKPGEKNYLIMGSGLGAELVLWHNIFIRGDWGHAMRGANGISHGHNEFYFSSTFIY